MRDGLRLLLGRVIAVLQALEGFAAPHGRRFPASPTPTSSRRSSPPWASGPTLWMQDFALDVEEMCAPARRAPVPRLPGDHRDAGLVPRAVRRRPRQGARARAPGHGQARASREQFAVTGQTYPRKADSMVLDALSGIAQSAAKMAGDLRLLQHEGELLEPFESEQIGSSAMAYKRNPMRAERIAGLARFVISLQANGAAHRGHPVARAHARRQRQPPPDAARGIPRRRRHPGARRPTSPRGSRSARTSFAGTWTSRCRSWPPSAGSCSGSAPGATARRCTRCIRRHSLAVAEAVSRGAANDLLDRLAG